MKVKVSVAVFFFSLCSLVASATAQFNPSLADLWSGKARFVADPSFNPPPLMYHAETSTVTFKNRYYMFYRTSVNQPPGKYAIALATSNDGDTWIAYNRGNPVLQRGGAPGNADNDYLIGPSVHSDGTALSMVYEAWNGKDKQTIAAATSTDGIHWTKLGTIISPGTGWEKGNVGTPSVYVEDGRWFVFYHGFRGSDRSGALARGFASGTSLNKLEKHGPPVLRGTPRTWTDIGIGLGDIVKEDKYYYMVFEAARGSAYCNPQAQYGWGIARSKDLLSWEEWPYNPILSDLDGTCGNDMPSWQIIGNRVMVVTTRFDTKTVRRLKLTPSLRSGVTLVTYYEGKSHRFHRTGRLEGNKWVAQAPRDKAEFFSYGPFDTILPPGLATAKFRIGGSGTSDSTVIATLDVYDTTENSVKIQKEVTAKMLLSTMPSGYVDISLPFLIPPDPHKLEFRIWYKGIGALRADKISIVTQ